VALPCVSSPCEELPETVSTSSMGVFCLRGCLAVGLTRVVGMLPGIGVSRRQGILELGVVYCGSTSVAPESVPAIAVEYDAWRRRG
jgi:hypothetical protein